MISYISAKEAAEKWNISHRRVATLCGENRIEGAMMVGNMWIIPNTAEKPDDKRVMKNENRETAELKPFLKWVGGKTQLINEIDKLLSCDKSRLTKYCEPMVGGGAFLFHALSKYDFKEIYISDINPELINAYNAIKSGVDELISRLMDMQYVYLPMDCNGRKFYYYSIRDKFNNTQLSSANSIEKASYFIFLNKTCFNGLYRVNGKGQFNVPMGSYKNPTILNEINLRLIHDALKNVQITCGDYNSAARFIDEKTFVYLDPPFRPISATSAFTSYNESKFDDGEQFRLAKFIDEMNSKGAKIVLSNSDPKNVNEKDNFFDDLYKNYNIKRVAATRMINSKANNRGKINELLIYN